MHSKYWEDLIPFYVAGTLSWQEAQQVEQHVRTCAECRQAITDWQKIAGAVRAEAAANLSDLPPLSPNLRVIRDPRLSAVPVRRNTVRRIMMPLTSAAAALMVIAFAVLLAANALRPDGESTDVGAGTEGETGTPTESYNTTPTADLMATIEALTTQHANGTDIANIVTPLNFATNTPSREPVQPTFTPTLTAEVIQPPLNTPAPSAPIAVVMGDAINLREGPGTNYPVVGSAQNGERFEILARSGSGANLWYVIRRGQNGTAWVYGSIVQIEPENAIIPAAATIPPPPPTETAPPPTATITPSPEPTGSFVIRSGAWALVTTIVEDTCGGDTGVSSSVPHILIPAADGQTVVFTYTLTGTSFVLNRDSGVNVFASAFNTPTPEGNANVTVQIVFDANGTTYTGTELISYPNGCITRSLWAGRVG